MPQYPEEVLRETVNNALAHRDYSINKQVIISIKPGQHISIRNPGSFRPHLLIEHPRDAIPLRRIIPEARARNPKLADVLRVYRKWEGRGIGMATLGKPVLGKSNRSADLSHSQRRSNPLSQRRSFSRRGYERTAGFVLTPILLTNSVDRSLPNQRECSLT